MRPSAFGTTAQGAAWASLSPASASQLALVVLGLKPATIIHGAPDVVHGIAAGRGFVVDIDGPDERYPVATVSTARRFAAYRQRLAAVDDDDPTASHRVHGWFLGYPRCCVEQYVAPLDDDGEDALRQGSRFMASRFGRQLAALLVTGAPCPEPLLFAPTSFTPCNVTCPCAIAMLSSYATMLDRFTPEIARSVAERQRAFLHRAASLRPIEGSPIAR